jgi:hypothetical protein
MPEEQNQTVISLLTNLTRDTSQIKTDLAVNTTKTGYIEDHLRTLNGKVVKQEERQQRTDKELADLTTTTKELKSAKRRWDDGLLGLIKQIGLFGLGILSAYIIFKLTH